jgi:hypothetical protein
MGFFTTATTGILAASLEMLTQHVQCALNKGVTVNRSMGKIYCQGDTAYIPTRLWASVPTHIQAWELGTVTHQPDENLVDT